MDRWTRSRGTFRSAERLLACLVILPQLFAACAGATPGPTASAAPTTSSWASATITAPPAATASPTQTSTPTRTPTSTPTRTPTGRSAPPTSSVAPSTRVTSSSPAGGGSEASRIPPAARLVVAGKPVGTGTLGSYTYRGAGSDSPWLPARALPRVAVAAHSALAVALEHKAVVAWTAEVAAASDIEGSSTRELASGQATASPVSQVTLPSPGRGAWVMAVRVVFAADLGDAVYFWSLAVR